MRTYTHGIIGYLFYLRGSQKQRMLAVIGAVTPDLILAFGFIFHFLGDSPFIVGSHRFFHFGALHKVTELMHSFVFVIPLLILAYFFYKVAVPFFIGMLSHVILDLLTHQTWAYNHLFPIPFEPIRSVISYTSIWFTSVISEAESPVSSLQG